MRIDVNSPVHKKVVEFVNDCFKLSQKYMEQRYAKWNKCEKMNRSYIDVSETDAKGKKMNPFERQVYIPMSRACKDTYLTYLVQVFCGKRPAVSIGATAPEDVTPAKRMEVILDYQNERQRYPLVVYAFCNDVALYGLGHIKNLFSRDYATTFGVERQIVSDPFPRMVTNRVEKQTLVYEGPSYTNADVYKFFPDPRVPMAKFQDGQFCGYEYNRSYYYLKKKEREGIYQNIDHLKAQGYDGELATYDETQRDSVIDVTRPNELGDLSLSKDNPHYKIRELWVEFIPRDLFGDTVEGEPESMTSYPETWVLVVANDRVVIRAERMVYAHGKFPGVSGEFDYDGYSLFNQSFYESIEGLQDLMNWLYNSHIDNVRRALNDSFVVDPTAINIRDLTKPSPMKIIRLTQSLWGKGVNIDSVLKQLQVTDVTEHHVKDAMMIADMMQRRTRATDTLQGIETEVKRTATEISKMASSSTTTLGMWAMLLYAQALIPLAEMSVMNNQQFLSRERYYRVLGDYAKEIRDLNNKDAVFVSPEEIQGYFDFPINDGRIPIQPEQNAQIWSQIFQTLGSSPPIQGQIDIFAVFREMAMALGAKNIDQFRVQVNVMPDEQIARQAQAGDMIPLEQYAGRAA